MEKAAKSEMQIIPEPEAQENPWLRVLLVVPLIAAAAVIFITVRGFTSSVRPKSYVWSDVRLVSPVDSAKLYNDQGDALFEVDQAESVRAAIAGTVASRSPRTLVLSGGSTLVAYRGLITSDLHQGAEVKAGDVVGKLEIGRPDPVVARLWLHITSNGATVSPLAPARFTTEAQRILSMSCVGCHQMRGVYPLADGKMRNGDVATAKAVMDSIREGGGHKRPLDMPPFKYSLSEDEIKLVADYLCRDRCVSVAAQLDSTRH